MTTPKIANSFKKYYELTLKIKELQEAQEKYRLDCLNSLKMLKTDKLPTDYGTFSIVKRKEYEYSFASKELIEEFESKIKVVKSKIKRVQDEDVKSGSAKEIIKENLRFQPVKINNNEEKV